MVPAPLPTASDGLAAAAETSLSKIGAGRISVLICTEKRILINILLHFDEWSLRLLSR